MANHSNRIFDRPTFVTSERRLARYVARPILRFIGREVASGVLLLVATAAALIWVNSPWGDSYLDFWLSDITLTIHTWSFDLYLRAFVNDALMAIFFFVVGLEIKRELVTGRLNTLKVAALPGIAALGGIVLPAGLYFAINSGGAGADGWGIPMATDIAFALGVVALLGSRVSSQVKLFLLTLAIIDDIGAIAVIAIWYTDDLSLLWLAWAVAGLGLIRVLRMAKVWTIAVYVIIGAFVWYATYRSGVHATIAGVVLGLMTPARPLLSRRQADEIADEMHTDSTAHDIRESAFNLKESVSVAERLEEALHPFTSFMIIPIFALANAGIPLSVDALSNAASSNVTIGVVLGLVVGKPVGVVLFTYIATRLGFDLPRGMNWGQFVGLGFAAGIGFTVSIFITGLAFDDVAIADEAKIGILFASALAAVLALVVLRAASLPDGADADEGIDEAFAASIAAEEESAEPADDASERVDGTPSPG